MRLESMASRLDFDERRARALEGVVQYPRRRRAAAAAADRSGPQDQQRRDHGRRDQGQRRPGPAGPGTAESRRPQDQGRRALGPGSLGPWVRRSPSGPSVPGVLSRRQSPVSGPGRQATGSRTCDPGTEGPGTEQRARRGRQRAPRAPPPPPRPPPSGRSVRRRRIAIAPVAGEAAAAMPRGRRAAMASDGGRSDARSRTSPASGAPGTESPQRSPTASSSATSPIAPRASDSEGVSGGRRPTAAAPPDRRRIVKLAVVVQRYGADINGGAEQHARYIAERLSRHASVEVVTTCARDYVTWKNELPAGVEQVNGITRPPLPGRARAEAARVRPALGPGVRQAALDRRRAAVAGQRGAGEPRAGALRRTGGARPRLRRPLQLSLLPRVAPGATDSGEGRHRADRRTRSGDRPLDLRPGAPRRARPHVQLAGRARDDPGGGEQRRRARRRRRRRLGRARSHRPGAVPPEVQDEAAVRDLHRPDRREQGLPGAVLPLPALRGRVPAGPRPGPRRQRDHQRAEASAHPSPGLPRRSRQVRRARRRRSADHAVVLREPVDGGARGVGARPAGARERALRRAEGPVPPEQRRAVSTRATRSSSRRSTRSSRTDRSTRGSAGTAGSSSSATTPGR